MAAKSRIALSNDVVASAGDQLVVITGASGKQAAALIPHIYGKVGLALVCHTSKSCERLKEAWPSAKVIKADLTVPEDCTTVVKQATTVFHVGPSFHPKEQEIGINVIDASLVEARSGRLKHFIFSSVIHPQLRKLLHHDCKRHVEEYLLESDLNYTILQPTTFLDNVPVSLISKRNNPFFTAMYNPDVEFTFLALKDLGEVAAKVILEGRPHFWAVYPLVSTEPMTVNTLIGEIGKQIGKTIPVEQKTPAEATDMLCTVLFGDLSAVEATSRKTAEHMILYYNRRGLKASPNVLEWVLGRKATGYKEWVTTQLSGT